ncbi:MAG: PD-(D/E)XK nuclease family protein, partial [Muribaculaceae bacterium]|nr:PD-(D/E)XK nuclease family protein [Muribaculaceae bacterium]
PTGEALIITTIMKKYIGEILRYDVKRAPITLISAEAEEKGFWEFAPGKGINFKQYIDRLDMLPDGTIRVIDYKTGSDMLNADSIEYLFTPSEKLYTVQGIFQLMLYACFHNYCESKPDQPLRPIIYKVKDFFGRNRANSEEFTLKINKNPITNHLEYKEEFLQRLEQMIDEIFNPDIPFKQCSDSNMCEFCGFTNFCRR